MTQRGAAITLAIAIHVLAMLIGVWDLWASFTNQPEASISRIVAGWSKLYPALPLLVGFIAGHIWG